MTILLILGLLAAALLGAPVFTVLSGGALLAFARAGISASAIISEMTRLASAPILVSIPLFTFAGYLFAESRTPERMVRMTRASIGWLPGGLAIVALFVTSILTAFTGASGATIVAAGGLLMPALRSERYSERFSLGLVTTSGSLGLLFPPSLPLILYSYVASQAASGLALSNVQSPGVDRLFLAGILPGAFLIAVLTVLCVREARAQALERVPFRWGELWASLREGAFELPLPLLVLGGIYSGKLTVTEAATVTALYALIVEVFIYRDIPIRKIPKIAAESMTLVGGILIMLGAALGLTNYLVDAQIPMRLLEWVKQAISSKVVFLLVLNLFLLVVGSVIEIFSSLIVVVPLIVPLAAEYGVDLVHLGIIFLANLEVGYLLPPVGLNLFISSFRFRKPMLEVYRSVGPWLLALLIGLAIITYLPGLSLLLLRLVPVK